MEHSFVTMTRQGNSGSENAMQRTNPESITVLVFKDNYAARTFDLPIAWVSRFGLLIGVLVGVTFLTASAAFRFYWLARKTDPARVLDLEQEISDLREAQRKLPIAAPVQTPLAQAAAPAQAQTTLAQATQAVAQPLPVAVASASPIVAAAVPAAAPTVGLLGGDLVLSPSTPATELPFKVDRVQGRWKNGKLEVSFALLYTKADGGAQKGRIVVLARGEKAIAGYPDGSVLHTVKEGAPAQVDLKPREGEYFSVGRYREVQAEFPKTVSSADAQTAEILIYDNSLKLLVQQRLPLKVDAPAKPAPKLLRRGPVKKAAAVETTAPAAAPAAAESTATAAPIAPAAPAVVTPQ